MDARPSGKEIDVLIVTESSRILESILSLPQRCHGRTPGGQISEGLEIVASLVLQEIQEKVVLVKGKF